MAQRHPYNWVFFLDLECDAPYSREERMWWYPIFTMRTEDREDFISDAYARLLCGALAIQRECQRPLKDSFEAHHHYIFTNFRVTQVYCFHSYWERVDVCRLSSRNCDFPLRKNKSISYESFTEEFFRKARPYLVYECVFPDGLDMEALSPLDANAQVRVKEPPQKPKVAAVQPLKREKDHPPPPPPRVVEPPSSDRPDGGIYETGRLLGKGGFAICYEGALESTRERFALKIVKSKMPQKKMEQKVHLAGIGCGSDC
jgi:hypothetical protein